MSYDIKECCPKCERPECVGDCGMYSREEKEDFIRGRYFREDLDAQGRIKIPVVQLEKNPLPPLKLGGYVHRSKKKAK